MEQAIVGGLYAKVHEAEFQQLNQFTEKLAKKYELEGYTQEAREKTSLMAIKENFISSHWDSQII